MKPFDIYIAFVSWGDSGKRRPVLILSEQGDKVFVFQITSQFINKSPAIQIKYFEIKNWKKAGLGKLSYIDTGKIIEIPKSKISIHPIGKLTESDKSALSDLLNIVDYQ